jgi:hypothetical protein
MILWALSPQCSVYEDGGVGFPTMTPSICRPWANIDTERMFLPPPCHFSSDTVRVSGIISTCSASSHGDFPARLKLSSLPSHSQSDSRQQLEATTRSYQSIELPLPQWCRLTITHVAFALSCARASFCSASGCAGSIGPEPRSTLLRPLALTTLIVEGASDIVNYA